MYISRSVGWMMHCSGRNHVLLLKNWWRRDGQMLYENFTPTKRSIHFGITSAMLMVVMLVYASIISYLVRTWINVSLVLGLTVMFADGKKQAIMLLYGLNWTIKFVTDYSYCHFDRREPYAAALTKKTG